MSVKITKEELADGSVRWRARGVSTGRDPVTGKRRQRTLTGRTKGEVEREVRKIGVAVDKGVYVKPWDGTVSEMCDSWLRTATRGKEVPGGWRRGVPAKLGRRGGCGWSRAGVAGDRCAARAPGPAP